MIYSIKRTFVWLSRWRKTRGFGVQSPSAYSFIRYVINEHYPYYAYDDLEYELPDIDKMTRKLCRLYFRISNYSQGLCWYSFNPCSNSYKRYVESACSKTKVEYELPDDYKIDVARITLNGEYKSVVEKILSHSHKDLILILEGIKYDKETKQFWISVLDDPRTCVSYDLYYCGIVFFDLSKFKQNYIVNF